MDPSSRKQRYRPRRRASLCVLSCASLLDFASSWSLGSFSHSRIAKLPQGQADGGPFITNGRPGRLLRDGDGSSIVSSVDRRPDRRRADPTRALRARRSREEDAEEGPNYWESDDVNSKRTRRTRDPTDYFDDDEDDFEDGGVEDGRNAFGPSDEEEALEWEACPTADSGTAHVLLPPYMGTSSSSGDRRGGGGGGRRPPTCVIHFVGGTFFGSSPTVWYGKLLRDVVRHSSAAVIASSIPVTVLQSPLQHVQLAKKVARQFEAAYNDVLVDEYGAEALRTVPMCALGHSLGSRLLVVSATLQQQSTSKRRKNDSRRDNAWVTPPPYRSYILMSFTNFGAAAGIPGVGTLYKARRQVDRQQQQTDAGGAHERRQQRRQPQQRRPAGRRPKQGRDGEEFDRFRDVDDELDEDDYNGYDDDYDADIAGLWEDLTSVVKESATWIQSSLTPDASALEFYPTPAQLWKALRPQAAPDRSGHVNGVDGAGQEGAAVGGGGRYRVPQTLLIQFDQDRVDQSAKLAATIRACSDVTFARLRGTHLSPLSPNPQSPGSLLSRGVRGQGAASKQQGPVEPTSQALVEQSTLSDLRQTIVRYTTEVVTKGIGQSQDVQV
jgi:Protein of unknown function (DUF1350)